MLFPCLSSFEMGEMLKLLRCFKIYTRPCTFKDFSMCNRLKSKLYFVRICIFVMLCRTYASERDKVKSKWTFSVTFYTYTNLMKRKASTTIHVNYKLITSNEFIFFFFSFSFRFPNFYTDSSSAFADP